MSAASQMMMTSTTQVTPPVLSMTKNNWITTQHFDCISQWDWEACLAFLNLSETSQHKLPGSTMTTAKVRRQVVDRLRSLIMDCITLAQTSSSPPQQPPPSPPLSPPPRPTQEEEELRKAEAVQLTIQTIITQLQTLLPVV